MAQFPLHGSDAEAAASCLLQRVCGKLYEEVSKIAYNYMGNRGSKNLRILAAGRMALGPNR
jgi:hypothetical protein